MENKDWLINPKLFPWVKEMIQLCTPKEVHVCDGSDQEFDQITSEMEEKGSLIYLNPEKRKSSFLAWSNPHDVARIEASTYICSKKQKDAGPTNNWMDPEEMKEKLLKLFSGSMSGRTMYVIPFCLGPFGSPMAKFGVQLTDSPYVACSMKIMTRMGMDALNALGEKDFVCCLHSVGVPIGPERQDVAWPCNNKHKYIAHFPEQRMIWSYGSGYGGNALLSKKAFALRIASKMGQEEGWLAEHMMIAAFISPEGERKYIAGAFPSFCGKTNLAMLQASLPGWKVECVGDDIAWLKVDEEGVLRAINPEAGFFGVAPGTSMKTNPVIMQTIRKKTIFTNTAFTDDGDVWWEGMTANPPEHLINWKGEDWTPSSRETAAHPNARFTVHVTQCPVLDSAWDSKEGVPISAIIFGGRRGSTIPLACESFSWQHGVFMLSSLSSETTAASEHKGGALRHDPFAMLPFCGYNMGDYFKHWLEIGEHHSKTEKMPKIFQVNWFRKSKNGEFLWPGFGENIRVIKWILERVSGKGKADLTPMGYVPSSDGLDLSNLKISKETLKGLLSVDNEECLEELNDLKSYFATFGDKLPHGIKQELEGFEARLK